MDQFSSELVITVFAQLTQKLVQIHFVQKLTQVNHQGSSLVLLSVNVLNSDKAKILSSGNS